MQNLENTLYLEQDILCKVLLIPYWEAISKILAWPKCDIYMENWEEIELIDNWDTINIMMDTKELW